MTNYNILYWILFIIFIIFLIIFDIGILNKNKNHISLKSATLNSIFYIAIAIIFGITIIPNIENANQTEYFNAYLIEKLLSLDNLFVISMIFNAFKIPEKSQPRILFYGILGVLIFRAIMIIIGVKLIQNFQWVIYILGIILIISGVKILHTINKSLNIEKHYVYQFIINKIGIIEDKNNDKFFTYQNHKLKITKLLAALICIELMDIIFAIDSIPAIFGITNNIYVIYTSNIFAIVGLRSLYFVLHNLIKKFYYIKYSISIILIYIGLKIFIDNFIYHIPPLISLLFTLIIVILGIIGSIIKNKKKHII